MTTYIFKIITLLGGLALFLFGMDVMGKALERQAGGKLQTILAKMSSNVFKGFLLGLGVTAVIQSSSATTVMVVGLATKPRRTTLGSSSLRNTRLAMSYPLKLFLLCPLVHLQKYLKMLMDLSTFPESLPSV